MMNDQSFAQSSIHNNTHITTGGNAIETRHSMDSSFHQIQQMMLSQKNLDIGTKMQNAKNFINYILNMI
jgi:hypothetical protein